jgi:hypothetical protein
MSLHVQLLFHQFIILNAGLINHPSTNTLALRGVSTKVSPSLSSCCRYGETDFCPSMRMTQSCIEVFQTAI